MLSQYDADTPALAAYDVNKNFGGNPALTDFTMDIRASETHALVGENGSGKSTFVKILAGYHMPEAGARVQIAGKDLQFGSPHSSAVLGCRFVHQELGLVNSSSVLDNLCLTSGFPHRWGTIRSSTARRDGRRDLAALGLDLDLDCQVGTLSPSEKTGIAIARALRQQGNSPARVLVLDEPTATLPEREVERLFAIIATVTQRGVGVLYVSHRLDEVLQVADRVTVLRDGHKVRTELSADLDRAQLIRLLVGSEIEDTRRSAEVLARGRPHADAVIEVTDLRSPSITQASLLCGPGEILGVAGITGSGSSGLLGAMFGAVPRLGGSVRVGRQLIPASRPDVAVRSGLAYLPPDRAALGGIMSMSAQENLTLAGLSSIWGPIFWKRHAQTREAKRWFSVLSVAPRDGYKNKLQTFSGGNQQKVLLGKWLRLHPKVLLLDEPTQGVDIGARALIHSELIAAAASGMAIICSSTDFDELSAICQRIIIFHDGRISATLEGDEITVQNISQACLAGDTTDTTR